MKNFSICYDMPSILINTVQVSAYMAIYYAVREVLIPKFFDHGRWLIFGIALIVWTVVVILIWYTLMLYLVKIYDLSYLIFPESYGAYVLEGVQMYVPGMILLALESYEDAKSEEERLHSIEKEKLSAELNYLKSKINPQFIFNTLKSLKVYVDAKSEEAPDMILRLSEVLDYVLYRSQQSMVNLNEEIAVVKGFLQLERLRLGERLNVELNVKGDLDLLISPLILLSFIEEVLKSNTQSQSDTAIINILITIEYGNLDCRIKVQLKEGVEPIQNELVELRRQLLLTYPERHSIFESVDNNALSISLSIKMSV